MVKIKFIENEYELLKELRGLERFTVEKFNEWCIQYKVRDKKLFLKKLECTEIAYEKQVDNIWCGWFINQKNLKNLLIQRGQSWD